MSSPEREVSVSIRNNEVGAKESLHAETSECTASGGSDVTKCTQSGMDDASQVRVTNISVPMESALLTASHTVQIPITMEKDKSTSPVAMFMRATGRSLLKTANYGNEGTIQAVSLRSQLLDSVSAKDASSTVSTINSATGNSLSNSTQGDTRNITSQQIVNAVSKAKESIIISIDDLSQTSSKPITELGQLGFKTVNTVQDSSQGTRTVVVEVRQSPFNGSGDAIVKPRRGRPPKHKKPESPENPQLALLSAAGSIKRKRGRPPKRKVEVQEEDTGAGSPGDEGTVEGDVSVAAAPDTPPVKRKRGRPRKSESQKFQQTPVDEAEDGELGASPAEVLQNTDASGLRVSRRLAVRREAGYVAPWKSLMRNGHEDESDPDEDETSVSVPARPASQPKRGQTNARSATSEQHAADVRHTLQELIQSDSYQAADTNHDKPFSHAAACLSRHMTDQLTANNQELGNVLFPLATALNLTWSLANDNIHFLHGEMATLLQAQDVLQQICDGRSLEESFASQNITVVSIPEEPAPPAESALVSEQEEPVHPESENPSDELPTRDTLNQDLTEASGDVLKDSDTGAPIMMINPTTGEPYSRACAIFTNPEMATMTCDICNFVTTEKGLLKHKVRKHPELVFECEVCLMKFGVRYDMRRHRLKHFDSDGVLQRTYERSFRKRFPEFTGPITLGLLEAEFTPPEQEKEEKGVSGGGQTEEIADSITTKPVPRKTTRLPSLKSIQKIHLCEVCDFQGTQSSIMKHKLKSHPKFLYKCPKCPCELGELVEFLRHYTKHIDATDDVKEINIEDLGNICECTECGHEGTEEDLANHVKTAHLHQLICRHCENDTSFTHQRTLQNHFRLHHRDLYAPPSKSRKRELQLPPDVSRCTCEVCGREVRLSWYHQHMKTHNRVTLRCQLCDFQTWKRFAMKNHLLTKHGPKQFMCHVCGQTFAYKSAQQNHMKNKHPDKPQVFPCPHCTKTFSVRRFMMTHVKRMHLKEKKYFCDICGRGFFENIRMKQHREVHAPEEQRQAAKTFKCLECPSRFRSRAKLLQHAIVHTGKRPHKCNMCQKAFTFKAELTKHTVSRHSDERPFRCTVCHKAFKFRHKLTTHMITHTRQSRHTCPTCGKAFTQRATLRKHRCRLPVYTANDRGVPGYIHVSSDSGQTNQIYIPQTQMVVDAETLEQVETAEAGTSDECSLSFLCGICEQLFPSTAEINEHVLTVHGESVTLVVENEDVEQKEVTLCEVELETEEQLEQQLEAGQPMQEQLTQEQLAQQVTQEQPTQDQLTQDQLMQEQLTQQITQEHLTQEQLTQQVTQEQLIQEQPTQEQLTQQLTQEHLTEEITQEQLDQEQLSEQFTQEQLTHQQVSAGQGVNEECAEEQVECEILTGEETVLEAVGEQLVTVHMVEEQLVETSQQVVIIEASEYTDIVGE